MKHKRRRIRRWLWNGAVIVSLVMMVGVGGLWLSNLRTNTYVFLTTGERKLMIASGGGVGAVDVEVFDSPDSVAYQWKVTQLDGPKYWKQNWTNFNFRNMRGPRGQKYLFRTPLWFLFVVSAILPTLWLNRRYRNRHKRLPGHCSACGYDLTGTIAARRNECPECGAGVTEEATTA